MTFRWLFQGARPPERHRPYKVCAADLFPVPLAIAIRLREPRSVSRHFGVVTRFVTTQTAAAQQCFRSRPLLQEKGSVVSVFSHMAREECAHDISLNERVGVSPTMPPLLQRLLTVRIRRRIVLRHLQLIGIEFDDLTAGACSLAFEMLYKLTHARPIRRTSVIALIGSITVLFNLDRATGLQQIVHKLAVVAFAGSRQTPVVVGKLGRHFAPAIAGVPNRRTCLYGSVGVVVVGIVRPI